RGDYGGGFGETVALVDGHSERGEEILLLPVEEGASAHAIEDGFSEDHLLDPVEDDSLREHVGQEGARARGEGGPVPTVPVPGLARVDPRREDLLYQAALLLDARDDLLHEVARERGYGHDEGRVRLLEVDRYVAEGGDAPAPRVDEVEGHPYQWGDVEAGRVREGMIHREDD